MSEQGKGIVFSYEANKSWEPTTWYRGRCQLKSNGRLFDVLIYSGFLDSFGRPGNYSGVFSETSAPSDADDVFSVNFPDLLIVTEKLFTVTR